MLDVPKITVISKKSDKLNTEITQRVIQALMQTQEEISLLSDCLKNDSIVIRLIDKPNLVNFRETAGNARWDPRIREIHIEINSELLNMSAEHITNSIIDHIRFELCNASNPYNRSLTYLLFDSRESYAREVERIEFYSYQRMHAIKSIYAKKEKAILISKEYKDEDFEQFFKEVSNKKGSNPLGSHADIYRDAYDQIFKKHNEQFEKAIQHCFNLLDRNVPFDQLPLETIVQEARSGTCQAVQDKMAIDRSIDLLEKHALAMRTKKSALN